MSSQETQFHREFTFTDHDFEAVREILYANAGISLNTGNRDLVYGRLARRLRACRFGGFSEYLRLLDSPGGEQEMVHFLNALTTNLTGFFREPHHFDYLASNMLPEVADRPADDRQYRIWSAGCSSGEEPYSIAMVARECLPCAGNVDVQILATDLDSSVVERARQGRYSSERIAGLSRPRASKWFRRINGADSCDVQVDTSLRSMIEFKQLNLMHEWHFKDAFDVIFCRNVMIYFDKPTQRKLFDRYADCLVEGGYLFVGRSESVCATSDRFELAEGRSIYRKR
ncbi:MAG: protein-glutamate O-methyltransferase CheR [Gammaproteobacteria bacterium]|nr:MAG: protein-glutamate O-methyltransferase CheR [Gammaproteobacteria bacterium]